LSRGRGGGDGASPPRPEFSLTRKITDQHLLSAAALLLPLLGFLAPLGIAPLLTVVAVGLIAVEPRSRLRLAQPFRPLAIVLALLSLWGALSAAWSTIPQHSLFEAERLALLSASGIVVASAGLALDPAGAAKIGRASLVGLGLGIIVALVEFVGDFPIHRALSGIADRVYYFSALDRGAVVLAVTCWIAIRDLILRRRLIAAALVFVVTLLTLAQLFSLSALLGFLVAAVVFALAWWRPRIIAAVFIAGFAVLTVALPLIHPTSDFIVWLSKAAPWLRGSAFHRLIIWRFASDRVAEHPLLGWGMDASRALPDGSMDIRDYLHLPPDFLYGHINGAVMPLHPHDAILQWWLELGIVGALLGLAVFAWTAWHAGAWRASPRIMRAAGLAIVAAALPPLLLDFGVWQAWWQSTLWFAAAFAMAAGEPAKPVD
jgi:exopolysaccharide production protein ExoQ